MKKNQREREAERRGVRSACLPSPPCGAELELPAMVVVASEVGEWSEWWWCFPLLLPQP